MVISAPTGSGKTVLFELCILRLLSRFLSSEWRFNLIKGTLKTVCVKYLLSFSIHFRDSLCMLWIRMSNFYHVLNLNCLVDLYCSNEGVGAGEVA